MRFIPVNAIQPGMILARDIICKKTDAMLRKGVVITESHIQYLTGHGYIGAYISDRVSEDIVIRDVISDALFQAGVEAVENENIGHIINVSTGIVNEILQQDTVTVDMMDLRSFDDYTYHHSVNVAVYCTAVGKKMGLSRQELGNLSQAALCHDLGKSRIPADILNKPGKLTDEEYEIIKTHPQKSVDVLNEQGNVSAIIKQAVLLHHENENGSGYPLHKLGHEIPLFAKILHAADVYDALTSRRPYKEPYAPADAFEYLKGGCDILFDSKVVDAMLQVVPAYPPGIDVKLSNGLEAIVFAHTSDALRPKVKLKMGNLVVDLSSPENAGIMIVESGIMPSDYVGEIDLLNDTRNIAPATREKILIVDDQVMSQMQTRKALGEAYEVALAKNGLEALEMIAKNPPNLLIVDIDMPVMDGFSFVSTLHMRNIKNIPIIFLTGKADRDTVEQCIRLGASDYVVKPARPVYLQERVAIALQKVRE